MIETAAELSGRRVAPGDAFPFRCHADLACFNSCCRDKRLTLLPYDVVRLARNLRLRSEEFLERHGELEIEAGSGWPMLRIRLRDDGRCPFVGPTGCGVYPDRPTCCRIYPLARAVTLDTAGEPAEHYVVAAPSDRCLGFGAPDALTVEGWVRGQGLDAYRAANNRAAKLLLHPRRPRPLALSTGQVHAVVMALYNLDVFRRFVAQEGFGGRSGLPEDAVARALTSDEALLELGQHWLAAQLFGSG